MARETTVSLTKSRQKRPQVMVLNPNLPSIRKVAYKESGSLRRDGIMVTAARKIAPRWRLSPNRCSKARSSQGSTPENSSAKVRPEVKNRENESKDRRSKA